MDIEDIKEGLLERLYDIDDQQFEQFSKILVDGIEQPTNIELTPFHGDGGIDIRGHFGKELVKPRFGVQVKQFRNNIGTPAMRNFVGALQQHHYQIGIFITTSDFASGAKELAGEQDKTPITLINGDTLTEKMLEHEIGVTKIGEDSYEFDPEFWSIFDRTTSNDPVESDEVPQADSIEVLQYSLMAIDQGYRYKPEIADFLERKTDNEWTDRQADYYPSAGFALGYVHKDTIGAFRGQEMRQWGLTREGQEYIELIQSDRLEEAHEHFIGHVEKMEISGRIIPEVKERGKISHERLKEIITEESELNETTAARRASTIGRWLDELPYIRRKREGSILKYEFISAQIDDFRQSG